MLRHDRQSEKTQCLFSVNPLFNKIEKTNANSDLFFYNLKNKMPLLMGITSCIHFHNADMYWPVVSVYFIYRIIRCDGDDLAVLPSLVTICHWLGF